LSPESRAEYFRERRQKLKQLVFMLDRDKADELDRVLNQRKESRAAWFRRIVDQEISKGK